jgi:hypothetical protein
MTGLMELLLTLFIVMSKTQAKRKRIYGEW